MPTAFHLANAVNRLTRLTESAHPPHVRVQAACALVDVLSPNNPRHRDIQRMLQEANPFELARHKLRDLYDHDSTSPPLPLGEGWGEGPLAQVGTEGGSPEEDTLSEDDDEPG